MSSWQVVAPLTKTSFKKWVTRINSAPHELTWKTNWKLRKKNKKMESELFFSRTVNSVTKWQDLNGIVELIVSTPDVNVWRSLNFQKIWNKGLRAVTLQVLQEIGFDIDPANVENCHWIKSKVLRKIIIKTQRCQ